MANLNLSEEFVMDENIQVLDIVIPAEADVKLPSPDLVHYYKDYDEKKFRLIGLDCSLRGEEDAGQLSWFKDTLKGAKEKDYFVSVYKKE